MAERILGSHAVDDGVGDGEDAPAPTPGQHVTVEPDLVLGHDLSTPPGMRRWEALGFETVRHPERVIVVHDHYAPSASTRISTMMAEVEAWIEEQGIEHYVPAGEGISHNVMTEGGYVLPGELIVGSDSHTTTHGAFGAFATGIGHTDLGYVLGAGELWLRVPPTRKVIVEGTPPTGVAAKDLALRLMGDLTTKGAIYEALEYHGEAIASLAMYERATLSNLAVELGAMAGLVPPDATTQAYLEGRARRDYEPVGPDPDAEYVGEHRIDADDLEPLVAKPASVDNVDSVAAVAGTPVDQVFVGTCNNARFEDIAAFVDRLAGESVAPGLDLVVTPGSKQALRRMNEEGLSNELLDAGAMITTPGCGACFGAHGGVLGEGEVCLGTMNRNFPGRMGPGDVYLASPLTAAATAMYGEITDPREVT